MELAKSYDNMNMLGILLYAYIQNTIQHTIQTNKQHYNNSPKQQQQHTI